MSQLDEHIWIRRADYEAMKTITPAAVVEFLRPMKDDARHDFLYVIHDAYCGHCGSDSGYRCHCMNDE